MDSPSQIEIAIPIYAQLIGIEEQKFEGGRRSASELAEMAITAAETFLRVCQTREKAAQPAPEPVKAATPPVAKAVKKR